LSAIVGNRIGSATGERDDLILHIAGHAALVAVMMINDF